MSEKFFIHFLDRLSPPVGLLIYYVAVFACLFALAKTGFTVGKIKINDWVQVIGMTVIVFSFMIIFCWSNPYIQQMTRGNLDGASTIFYQTEDGAVWWLWYDLIGIHHLFIARILTFVITPFILTLIGTLLVKKVKLQNLLPSE